MGVTRFSSWSWPIRRSIERSAMDVIASAPTVRRFPRTWCVCGRELKAAFQVRGPIAGVLGRASRLGWGGERAKLRGALARPSRRAQKSKDSKETYVQTIDTTNRNDLD